MRDTPCNFKEAVHFYLNKHKAAKKIIQDWLKTDAGKLYKARTNKNYRQKKQQTKKDNLKVNKSFEFHFPCGITLKE